MLLLSLPASVHLSVFSSTPKGGAERGGDSFRLRFHADVFYLTQIPQKTQNFLPSGR